MSRLGEWLAGGLMISDGAWGTQLQARGLASGTTPDTWNLTHAENVESVARAYVEAGSQVILTNTFRANAVAMHSSTEAELDAINRAGVAISKRAAGKQALVFASIGPTGKILMSGEIGGEHVTAAFVAQAQSLAAAGADALLIETMSDIEEARLAVEAARRTGLPVLASFAFDSGKNKDRTMMGATPEAVAAAMVEAGADAVGANCGVGSRALRAHLQAVVRGLRPARLDQAKRGPAYNRRDGHSLRHFGGVFRVALRGFSRGWRIVCWELLRLNTRLHSGAGCCTLRHSLRLISRKQFPPLELKSPVAEIVLHF